jgi:hypothetical protein
VTERTRQFSAKTSLALRASKGAPALKWGRHGVNGVACHAAIAPLNGRRKKSWRTEFDTTTVRLYSIRVVGWRADRAGADGAVDCPYAPKSHDFGYMKAGKRIVAAGFLGSAVGILGDHGRLRRAPDRCQLDYPIFYREIWLLLEVLAGPGFCWR